MADLRHQSQHQRKRAGLPPSSYYEQDEETPFIGVGEEAAWPTVINPFPSRPDAAPSR